MGGLSMGDVSIALGRSSRCRAPVEALFMDSCKRCVRTRKPRHLLTAEIQTSRETSSGTAGAWMLQDSQAFGSLTRFISQPAQTCKPAFSVLIPCERRGHRLDVNEPNSIT